MLKFCRSAHAEADHWYDISDKALNVAYKFRLIQIERSIRSVHISEDDRIVLVVKDVIFACAIKNT